MGYLRGGKGLGQGGWLRWFARRNWCMARFVPQARSESVWAMIPFAVPLPEKTLIAHIRRMALLGGARGGNLALLTGIGDDCAVVRLRPAHDIFVTTDFSLEGGHFRRSWHPPESVCPRCFARRLSDIAAMGGVPTAGVLFLPPPA